MILSIPYLRHIICAAIPCGKQQVLPGSQRAAREMAQERSARSWSRSAPGGNVFRSGGVKKNVNRRKGNNHRSSLAQTRSAHASTNKIRRGFGSFRKRRRLK